MPKTITVPEHSYDVFTFNELSEDAKQKALDWASRIAFDDQWWQTTYEDAERIGLKITSFDDHRAEGKFITSASSCAESILKEHGESCETFKTATKYLADIAKIEDPENDYEAMDELNKDFCDSLLNDYLKMLRDEYEYQTSREAIEENILANEYTFDENGKRKD